MRERWQHARGSRSDSRWLMKIFFLLLVEKFFSRSPRHDRNFAAQFRCRQQKKPSGTQGSSTPTYANICTIVSTSEREMTETGLARVDSGIPVYPKKSSPKYPNTPKIPPNIPKINQSIVYCIPELKLVVYLYFSWNILYTRLKSPCIQYTQNPWPTLRNWRRTCTVREKVTVLAVKRELSYYRSYKYTLICERLLSSCSVSCSFSLFRKPTVGHLYV